MEGKKLNLLNAFSRQSTLSKLFNGIKFISSISILLTAGVVVFCSFMAPVFASNDDLSITEIMYDPDGADGGNEWIEVFDGGSDEFQLKGGSSSSSWRFIDQFKDGSPQDGHKHTFSSDITINPEEFLIISNNPSNFLENYPDYGGKIIKSSFSLPNDASSLALSSDGGKSWFSNVDYRSVQGASGNGKTLERADFQKNDWQESYALGGTPGEKSSTKKIYSKQIVISELLPNPLTDEENNEFIEIYNTGEDDVNLAGWSLHDKSGGSYSFPNALLKSREYLAIYRSNFDFALNNSGGESVSLQDPNGEEINTVSYSGTAKENYSYSFFEEEFRWTTTPTPGIENLITAESKSEIKNVCQNSRCPEKVFLNEILANPKKEEQKNEYIEIVNEENIPVDLVGWTLRDASKTGKFVWKEHTLLDPEKYLTLYRPETKLALNNSAESVYLFNPAGKLTSSVTWQKAPENISYNSEGKQWRWSKYLTPGKENKFDEPPYLKIKKSKNVYKNTAASFSVLAKDKETKKLKYIWDFGDGHKSYLATTSHKYLETGDYEVKLTVSDASQDVEKSFNVAVKKYPRPKIEIVRIVPNPVGLDSQNEYIVPQYKDFSFNFAC